MCIFGSGQPLLYYKRAAATPKTGAFSRLFDKYQYNTMQYSWLQSCLLGHKANKFKIWPSNWVFITKTKSLYYIKGQIVFGGVILISLYLYSSIRNTEVLTNGTRSGPAHLPIPMLPIPTRLCKQLNDLLNRFQVRSIPVIFGRHRTPQHSAANRPISGTFKINILLSLFFFAFMVFCL